MYLAQCWSLQHSATSEAPVSTDNFCIADDALRKATLLPHVRLQSSTAGGGSLNAL